MKLLTFIFLLILFPAAAYCGSKVKLGVDVLIAEEFELIKGKNIGIITHYPSISSTMERDVDLILKKGGNIKAIFVPEHGLWGAETAGSDLNEEFYKEIPVFPLYKTKKENSFSHFKECDMIIYHLQDIGTRFYTYISTLYEVLNEAKKYGKKVIILDRPNPISFLKIQGKVLEPKFSSFIGIAPIPIIHGMTVGEIASYMNKELGINSDIKIVKMRHYNRRRDYFETKNIWLNTSPNIPSVDTIFLYPGIGLVGETNLSVGIGTTRPFEFVGAPYIDPLKLEGALNLLKFSDVYFKAAYFIPAHGKYKSIRCGGVQIIILNRLHLKPVKIGLYLISTIKKLYPDDFKWEEKNGKYQFDLAMGSDAVRKAIDEGTKTGEIIKSWDKELYEFKRIRQKYLLYR